MQHVVDSALPLLLKAFDTDDDKEAVTAAVLGCEAILTGAGPQCCQSYMEPLATGASMVRHLAGFWDQCLGTSTVYILNSTSTGYMMFLCLGKTRLSHTLPIWFDMNHIDECIRTNHTLYLHHIHIPIMTTVYGIYLSTIEMH